MISSYELSPGYEVTQMLKVGLHGLELFHVLSVRHQREVCKMIVG